MYSLIGVYQLLSQGQPSYNLWNDGEYIQSNGLEKNRQISLVNGNKIDNYGWTDGGIEMGGPGSQMEGRMG